MKKQQRFKEIVDYLKDTNLTTVEELVHYVNVSPATIRRDLVELDSQGVVRRTHGGVTLNNFVATQLSFQEKNALFKSEKSRICKEAAKLIESGNTIILDAGTTTMEIAKNITHLPLRVITPDLRIALFLSQFKQIEVTVFGGQIDSSSQSCIGDHARKLLQSIITDISFISCNFWNIEYGVTAPTEHKSTLKIDMMNSSRRSVLVADSSKYGNNALFKIAELEQFEEIYTDSNMSDKNKELLLSVNSKINFI
ncbi:DeoR/GlpR family DNA-binding transcription regulator [Vibrio salinus]|uniref:DeoR/GlpR family DNA-binding transcription regulator n=1 Tax=Vibrio salinus TaxID=2899784 RepID=UPI001E30B003|nr:DeoR/GlpR family DNA-binding transcription regulator [Vibrio salinus]MCE0494888.1 DeoR/GlpR family DNA-binding transcription regulator [Vibrio salinus]